MSARGRRKGPARRRDASASADNGADDQRHGERLQKVLARAGVASRRKCEEYIVQGRVRVNGRVVTKLGTRVDPEKDRLQVDGKPVSLAGARHYYVLYKPTHCLSTVSDPHGRRTARELVPEKVGGDRVRLFPVGRLDWDSEGLLLFTDDGELTQRLLHPRYEHEKEYLVLVRGSLKEGDVQALTQGISLEGESRPAHASVRVKAPNWNWRREPRPRDAQWLSIVLKEGRKRQIRRMLEALGHEVVRLLRVRMGVLVLGHLAPGQGRWLKASEARALRRSAGLADPKLSAAQSRGKRRPDER